MVRLRGKLFCPEAARELSLSPYFSDPFPKFLFLVLAAPFPICIQRAKFIFCVLAAPWESEYVSFSTPFCCFFLFQNSKSPADSWPSTANGLVSTWVPNDLFGFVDVDDPSSRTSFVNKILFLDFPAPRQD